MLNLDLSEFSAGVVPVLTEGYYDLVEGGKADYEHTLEEMIRDEIGVFATTHFQFKTLTKQLKDEGHKFGQKGVVEVLERHGYDKCRGRKKVDGVLRTTPTFWAKLPQEVRVSEVKLYDFYTN